MVVFATESVWPDAWSGKVFNASARSVRRSFLRHGHQRPRQITTRGKSVPDDENDYYGAAAQPSVDYHTQRKYVRILFNGTSALGLIDNQSSCNFMRQDVAQAAQCKIRPTKVLFILMDGSLLLSTACTTILSTIGDAPCMPFSCIFNIIDQCPHPVVLGQPFLQQSPGLKDYGIRLPPIATNSPLVPGSVDVQNVSLEMILQGLYRRFSVQALLDIGSDVNLLPLELAKRLRLRITRWSSARQLLTLGNGTMTEILGTTEAIFKVRRSSSGHWDLQTTFFVVRNLAVSCVLGNVAVDSLWELFSNEAVRLTHISTMYGLFCHVQTNGKEEQDDCSDYEALDDLDRRRGQRRMERRAAASQRTSAVNSSAPSFTAFRPDESAPDAPVSGVGVSTLVVASAVQTNPPANTNAVTPKKSHNLRRWLAEHFKRGEQSSSAKNNSSAKEVNGPNPAQFRQGAES